MTEPRFRPLTPDELVVEPGLESPSSVELSTAMATGKVLEKIAQQQPMRPSGDFEDRVWAAIAAEPLPAPMTVAREALRRRSPGGLLASIADARRVAFGGARPWPARGRALALLMAAALVLASLGGAAAAGAVNLLAPAPAPTVTLLPSVDPSPSVTVLPEQSPSPSADESESPEPGTSEEPGESQEPSGSAATEGPDETGKPSETPEPSHTPEPSLSESPEPSPSGAD